MGAALSVVAGAALVAPNSEVVGLGASAAAGFSVSPDFAPKRVDDCMTAVVGAGDGSAGLLTLPKRLVEVGAD